MRRAILGLLLSGCFLSHPGGEPTPTPPEPPEPGPPPPVPVPVPPVEGEWFVYRAEPDRESSTRWAPRQTWAVDLTTGESVLLDQVPNGSAARRVSGDGQRVAIEVDSGRDMDSHTRLVDLSGMSRPLPGGRAVVAPGGTAALVVGPELAQVFDANAVSLHAFERPPSAGSFATSADFTRMLDWGSDDAGAQFLLHDLTRGGSRELALPGDFARSADFSADGRAMVVATADAPALWSLPEFDLYRVALDTGEVDAIDLPNGETPLAYRACQDTVVAAGPDGAVREYGPGSWRSPLRSIEGGLPPAGVVLGFVVDRAISPDGRYLLWLGVDGEDRLLQLTDLVEGTTRLVDIGPMPVSSACCGDVFTELAFGEFVDGAVSVGVTIRPVVPFCDCGRLTPSVEPAAYRLDLATGEATRAEHCGKTIPWLTRDGGLLVCSEPDGGTVQLAVDHLDGRVETISAGPWDVGVFPLERTRTVCR